MIGTVMNLTPSRGTRVVSLAVAMAIIVALSSPVKAEFLSAGPIQAAPQSQAMPKLASSAGPFDIVVNFLGGLTASQQAIFAQAEAHWEGGGAQYVVRAFRSGSKYD